MACLQSQSGYKFHALFHVLSSDFSVDYRDMFMDNSKSANLQIILRRTR
jgi:hypothetical protein